MTENENVALLPTSATIDTAWARYVGLAREVAANPDLALDRDHCSACARAWASFRDLLLAHDRLAAENLDPIAGTAVAIAGSGSNA